MVIDNKPAPRPCSMCGEMLKPFMHGTTTDSNYNTVNHYMFGHTCPAQSKAYDNRIKEIRNSGMDVGQQYNARQAAGMMNSWGS